MWEECLKEKLDPETRSQIIGCRAQMKVFNFYFGLCLGQKLYALTDNLIKSIQKEIMPAVTGQRIAAFTLKSIERRRNEEDFNLLFQTLRKKASDQDLVDATLPRKRKTPNYSMLHLLDDHRDQADAFYPSSIKEHFRLIYHQATDSITSAIKYRFDQPRFQLFTNAEQFLVKAAMKQSYTDEINKVINQFKGDIDASAIPAEISIYQTIFEDVQVINFQEIVKHLQIIPYVERSVMPNILILVKLLLVSGATNTTPERSFSLARRLKFWLRTSTSQRRFNSLAILNIHKEELDKISLIEVEKEFVENHPYRRNHFGLFCDEDLL